MVVRILKFPLVTPLLRHIEHDSILFTMILPKCQKALDGLQSKNILVSLYGFKRF